MKDNKDNMEIEEVEEVEKVEKVEEIEEIDITEDVEDVKERKSKSNKFRARATGAAITAVVLALIILLNVFVGMLTERFFIRADLTETGVFTLDERAAEFLREIDETVDIIVLSEESIWRFDSDLEIIVNILQNYSATTGGRIRVQYVNPDLNSFDGPRYNNSLSVLQAAYTDLEDMGRNDIIFLSERRATVISVWSLFAHRADQHGRPVRSIGADQGLISALTYVLNEEIARVTFIENHGEANLALFTEVFERSGYSVSGINLATEEIPEDTVVLVTVAPQHDFLDEEIEKIERYLMYGGNMMVLFNHDRPSLPTRLSGFVAEWGIAIDNDKIILDEEHLYIPQLGIIGAQVVAGPLESTVTAEEITTELGQRIGTMIPRPLRSTDVGGGITVHPLIQTFSASSYAKEVGEGGVETPEREPGDESGPFVLAYHARMLTRDADNEQVFANLIVADFNLFADGFLSMYGDTFYNGFLIANIAHDFNPFGGRIFIPTRDMVGSPLLISAVAARTILIVMVVLLPLAIMTAGVVVWRKRRHK